MPKEKIEKEDQKPKQEKVRQFKNIIPSKVKKIQKYLKEKDYAIKLRQTKVNNWVKNEEGYAGVVQKTLITRSNLHLPVLFEGVQNMKAKLGGVADVEYDTIPEGDENAHEIMRHIVKEDLDECGFKQTYKDSKIEAGIYGKTIYEVIPGNDYQKVELVDTLAYLISPIAKNTKDALYQGRQFIYKTIWELEDDAEEMEYDMEELQRFKDNKGAAEIQGDPSSEASLKNIRMATMGLSNTTNYGSEVAEITEWWTYWKGELYCMTVANEVYLLRFIKASKLGLKRPPFVAWGTYNRGITFWCPSVADIYRDPNLYIDVNGNQQIDNNTYRNFGMKFVSSQSGLKQSSIVARPMGITPIEIGPKGKIADHVMIDTVPEIGDTVGIMQMVKGFADAAAGLAPAQQHGKGKVSVTKQAQLNAEIDEKIKDMKENATNALEELYQLMADIIVEKLTKPRKVKIFGAKNITIEDVTKKNFKGVKLVAKAKPASDSQQNRAIKQKAILELFKEFKDDKQVPGQVALRRSVVIEFPEISLEEAESWFSPDKESVLPLSTENTPPGEGEGQPGAPGAVDVKKPTEPILSNTQSNAQNKVPPTIKA